MPRSPRSYPPEFRRQMMELVRSGRSPEKRASSRPGREHRVKVIEQRRARDPSAEFVSQGGHVSGSSLCVLPEQFLEFSGAEDHQHADGSIFGKIAPGMRYSSTDGDGRTGSDFRSAVSIRDER